MPHGAVVTVLIPGDDWAKVNYNGYTGYAVTYFLKRACTAGQGPAAQGMGGAALLLCGR